MSSPAVAKSGLHNLQTRWSSTMLAVLRKTVQGKRRSVPAGLD
jgi:hypothetical protein